MNASISIHAFRIPSGAEGPLNSLPCHGHDPVYLFVLSSNPHVLRQEGDVLLIRMFAAPYSNSPVDQSYISMACSEGLCMRWWAISTSKDRPEDGFEIEPLPASQKYATLRRVHQLKYPSQRQLSHPSQIIINITLS